MSRPAFYRVWFDGEGDRARFLGLGPTTPETRGYPSLLRVPECEAYCFDTARAAAETALQAGCIPFTVEVAL